ncbi:transposase [Burkholderia sp. Bp9126]|nr:transposase [Burkholderia sp. Bp9126]
MKCVVVLTETEESTLQQLSINHPYQDMRTRAAALLMLGGGLRPMAVGAKLGVSSQSVYNWAHTWREQGVIGLLAKIGHKGGRLRAVNDEMIAVAIRLVSTEPLTREQIVQRLEAQFGATPFEHLDTLSVALKRAGFTYKRNRFSLKKKSVIKRPSQ